MIYEVYLRSFLDTSGNGIGDLAGVTARLDYVSDVLGVDAIWVSPFYPSPMADFGYDVADYTDVDPLFGDLETFSRLAEEAHRRGLKVIVDWVPNHTSDRHAWFVEASSSRGSPKRDWYIWVDSKPDGSPPNNWVSMFGGSAWEWDATTDQFYLHSFLPGQPDLNWRNPQVRAAMLDVLRFWLDRGADGLRIDVAHMVMKDPELRDNPLREGYTGDWEYARYVHRHDQRHPDMHQLFREINTLLASYDGERVALAEVATDRWDRVVRYYGERLDGLHLPFNFDLIFNADWDAAAVRKSVDGYEAALPEGAWPTYVLGNHDQPRLATRVGRAQARIGAMLLLTLRGTPILYYGDELGMIDVAIAAEKQHDPLGKSRPGEGRDGCRTPMQWNDTPNGGFSPAAPWLPLNDDYRTFNVAAEVDDPTSMLSLYRRLLRYRKATPALHRGSYHPIDGAPKGCFAYLRQHDDQRVVALLNFTAAPLRVSLPHIGTGTIVASTGLQRSGRMNLADMHLQSNEGVLVELDPLPKSTSAEV